MPFEYQRRYADSESPSKNWFEKVIALSQNLTTGFQCGEQAPEGHSLPGYWIICHVVIAHSGVYPTLTDEELLNRLRPGGIDPQSRWSVYDDKSSILRKRQSKILAAVS